MATKSKKNPSFPTNYGWVMSNTHQYGPRNCSQEVYQRLCETLLRVDADFIHLLRQCADRWIVSVVLGRTSVHLNLYDPTVVDDPLAREMSQPANLGNAVFFEVDRHMNFLPVSGERSLRVRHTHPMFYAVRHLRLQDMKMLDSMQASLEGDLGIARAAQPVSDILEQIRLAEAEEPCLNRTPLLRYDTPVTPTTTKE
jgi:hypothetical protein